jgi:hypothetical protein
MDKKKIIGLLFVAAAVYGGYKVVKNVQAKGGVMEALNLKS